MEVKTAKWLVEGKSFGVFLRREEENLKY